MYAQMPMPRQNQNKNANASTTLLLLTRTHTHTHTDEAALAHIFIGKMDTFHSDFVHTGNSPWYVCHTREFDAAFNKHYKACVCVFELKSAAAPLLNIFKTHTHILWLNTHLAWYGTVNACKSIQLDLIIYFWWWLKANKRARLLRKLDFVHKATYLCTFVCEFFSVFLFVININVGKPDGYSLINRNRATAKRQLQKLDCIRLRISRASTNIIEINGK